jgi:hypothetical protein
MNKSKSLIVETGKGYELLQNPKKQQLETDFKILQMLQALTSVIGAALTFTTLFSGFATFLNTSGTIQTITLLILGGILGYYAFKVSKH